jgi:hypothetical protein
MQHEDQPADSVPEVPVQKDEWAGPWGSISPTPRSVDTLCIQIESEAGKPRIYYYPYRTIGKWNWSMDRPEILEIQAGGIQITISGSGLRRLAEALNQSQLRLVQMSERLVLGGDICIMGIIMDDLKN